MNHNPVPKSLIAAAALALGLILNLPAAESKSRGTGAADVRQFLEMYNRIYQQVFAAAEGSSWDASTDVTDEHTGKRIGAQQAKAAFTGNTYVIEKAREFLK